MKCTDFYFLLFCFCSVLHISRINTPIFKIINLCLIRSINIKKQTECGMQREYEKKNGRRKVKEDEWESERDNIIPFDYKKNIRSTEMTSKWIFLCQSIKSILIPTQLLIACSNTIYWGYCVSFILSVFRIHIFLTIRLPSLAKN